jgi:antitoxin MazE
MRTRISKWGNSLGVRIPKAFATEAGLDDGTEVEISLVAGRIVVTVATPGYLLADLVGGFETSNRHPETDWGRPEGKELW